MKAIANGYFPPLTCSSDRAFSACILNLKLTKAIGCGGFPGLLLISFRKDPSYPYGGEGGERERERDTVERHNGGGAFYHTSN